jgi:cell division septation protein DedD
MNRCKIAMLAGIAAWAIGLTGSTAFAQTPQASGQYGYGGPMASPQSGYPVPCHEMAGCHVVVGCPSTCHQANVPQQINDQLRGYTETPPTCQEANAQQLTLYSEMPPAHTYVDIWRNHYIPVRVTIVPKTPEGIRSFDVRVNYREVHVLCDQQGNPLPAPQAAAVLKELEKQYASNAPAGPATAPAAPAAASPSPSEAAPPLTSTPSAPAPKPAAAPDQAPAAAPTATATAPATPQKQWVWLAQEGVYGYGHQRSDGFWEIDSGSRRPTL